MTDAAPDLTDIPGEPSPVPVVIHKGVYTLWGLPDGGIRVQYKREDKTGEDHMELPGMVVRMAKAMSEGKLSPLQAIKMMKNAPRD